MSNADEVLLPEICSVHEMSLGLPYQGGWDGLACRTYWRGEKCTRNFCPKYLGEKLFGALRYKKR
jgi:hypothetical protein